MKYGFIGCGNMAGAIIEGCIAASYVRPDGIFVYDVNQELQKSREKSLGVQGCESLEALVVAADCVFLGVKPNALPELLPTLGSHMARGGKLIVSMAAGQLLQSIETMLNLPGTPIIRIMPNLNVKVGEGMTAVCKNSYVTQEQYEEICSFFGAIGMIMETEEKEFPVFSAIAGCSPAFTFLYIDSLAKAAQRLGMNKKKACAIAAQAVMGSAKLLSASNAHPWELIDSVCSPGGTTIEGICALESYQFQSAIVNAVDAAVQKDKMLSGS